MEQNVTAPAWLPCDYAFIMDDDSMINTGIREGDVIYFVACNHAENGQIVAVKAEGTVQIRLFNRKDDTVILTPANTDYLSTILIGEEADQMEIIGKAVAYVHSFE